MPTYVYESEAGGTRIELIVPIAQRDTATPAGFRRVQVVPVSFTGSAQDPERETAATMRTLSKLEDTIGRTALEQRTGYSAATLRKVWSDENAPAYEPIEPASPDSEAAA